MIDQAVYLVGAGLTKSLEKPGRPVPMMNDFVSVMADYVHDDVILMTLAHWETVPGSPYGYVLPSLTKLAQPLADSTDRSLERRADFRRALKNRPAESIEQLLQNVLTKPSGRAGEVVPVRFRYGINRVFQIIGWDVNLLPLLVFLHGQLTLARSHTVVSFNYDLVLDHAVSRVLGHPALGTLYGFDYKDDPDVRIRIIKPHGSLNFIGTLAHPYRHTPYGLAFEDRMPEVPGTDSREVRYSPDASDFKEPCSVPPVASKPEALKALGLTFLEHMREAERRAIEAADSFYVIGWSVPETDTDQRNLIRECIRGRKAPPEEVVAVNFGAPLAYFTDIAKLCGIAIDKMRVFNAGFCAFVEDAFR